MRRDCVSVVSCSETLSRISLEVRVARVSLKALEMLPTHRGCTRPPCRNRGGWARISQRAGLRDTIRDIVTYKGGYQLARVYGASDKPPIMSRDRHWPESCRFQCQDSPRHSVRRFHARLGSSRAMGCFQPLDPTQKHAERAQTHTTQAESTAELDPVQPTVTPRACDPLRYYVTGTTAPSSRGY